MMDYPIGVLKKHSEALKSELRKVEKDYESAEIEMQSEDEFFRADISNLKKQIQDCVDAINLLLNVKNK